MDVRDEEVIPPNFSGLVPLFPLPNMVAFPNFVQPLHIFEPRYRAMMKWTLGHEKLIAMAVPKPGWEQQYEDQPAIYPVVCIGKVIAHQRLQDGRYSFLLLGGKRAKIEEELNAPQPFRSARVSILPEQAVEMNQKREQLRKEVFRIFSHYLEATQIEPGGLEVLRAKDIPLGVLTDVVSSIVQLPSEQKYQLLSETNIDVRANQLLAELMQLSCLEDSGIMSKQNFPPEFSDN